MDLGQYWGSGSIPLSHGYIFHVLLDNEYIPECDDPTCQINGNLIWHGEDICNLNFFCPILRGNPGSVCEDFGVVASLPDDQVDICREGVIYGGKLSEGQSVGLVVWWASGRRPEVGCYFWCGSEGYVPKVPIGGDQVHKELESLVR